jgi:hypothetical protein
MNTFPLALSKKLEGEGKDSLGGGAEWLKILECEAASLSGPPDRIPLPGQGPREAGSHH